MSTDSSSEMNPSANEVKQVVSTQPRRKFDVATNENNTSASLFQFGWEQIDSGPLLPFIKRGAEKFLSWHILVDKVFKNILTVFSREMLSCISLPMTTMTKNEADVFNEININHCNKTLVGAYSFTPRDFMVSIRSAKKFVKFFYAFRNLIFTGNIENDLFGFIRIDGKNEIPFIWHANKKFVPSFYFEGIDAIVTDLVCPWKMGYLQFCFKMQKIRSDLYKNIPFKVIDFKNVEALFPAGTNFELCCPENINQELLAPELQTVSTVTSATRKRLAEPSAQVQAKQPRSDLGIKQNLAQKTNQLKNPQLVGVGGDLMKSHEEENDLSITPVYDQRSTQRRMNVDSDISPQDVATMTLVPQIAEPKQADDVQLIESQPARNEIPINQPQATLTRNVQGFSDLTATNRLQQLATSVRTPASVTTHLPQTFYTNKSYKREYITNVPKRSPQVATSPGIRQTSPFMIAATETVQRQSESNHFGSQISPSEHVQQKYLANNNYSPYQSLNLSYQRNYDVDKMSFISHQNISSDSLENSLLRSKSADIPIRTDNLRTSRSPRESVEQNYTIINNNYTAKQGFNMHQRGIVRATNHKIKDGYPVKNALVRSEAVDLSVRTDGFQNSKSSDTLPVHSLETTIQQLADEELRLTQTLWQTKKKKKMLEAQKIVQMQEKTGSAIPKDHRIANRNAVPNKTGSVPPTDHQQYASSNTPVVQNVNVAVTNDILAETNVHNNPQGSATAATTNKTCSEGNLNEKVLSLKVVDHILNIDTYLKTYDIKHFFIAHQVLPGIRLSLDTNKYLINFGSLSERVLSVPSRVSQYRLSLRFNTLYRLNHVQEIMWKQAVPLEKSKLNGSFKNLFVELNEANSVLDAIELFFRSRTSQ